MTKKYLNILFVALFIFFTGCGGLNNGPIRINSPDENISVNFYLEDMTPYYSVYCKGKAIIENSKLGITLSKGGEFGKYLNIAKTIRENFQIHTA